MAAKDRASTSITWSESLLNFVQGPVFDKTRIKLSQISELAMEAHLKEIGMWDEYLQFQAEDIL